MARAPFTRCADAGIKKRNPIFPTRWRVLAQLATRTRRPSPEDPSRGGSPSPLPGRLPGRPLAVLPSARPLARLGRCDASQRRSGARSLRRPPAVHRGSGRLRRGRARPWRRSSTPATGSGRRGRGRDVGDLPLDVGDVGELAAARRPGAVTAIGSTFPIGALRDEGGKRWAEDVGDVGDVGSLDGGEVARRRGRGRGRDVGGTWATCPSTWATSGSSPTWATVASWPEDLADELAEPYGRRGLVDVWTSGRLNV